MGDNDEEVFTGVVMLFLVAMCFLYAVLAINAGNENREVVKAICDYSHSVQDGKAERLCGDVQDKTNTEYLCDTKGQCKVESK